MDKNTTIAFVLIGAILIIWLFLNTPEQEKQTPGTSDTTKVIDQKPEELPKTQSEEKTRQRQQNTTKIHLLVDFPTHLQIPDA
ncbi:MAG: hypothetical protein DYG97_06285 [Ignavibacteria bacterium CHB3]|nr:hypothetical protein [Ignavibacteria bacterium CHB3]